MLVSKSVCDELRDNFKNEITSTCAKFSADVENTSKVTSRIKQSDPVFGLSCMYIKGWFV